MKNEIQCAQDKQLAKRLLAGDERAFVEFVDSYFPKLYRYLFARLKDDELVEEILQMTLASAARYLHSYRGEASLLTWLIQISRGETSRVLKNHHKHREQTVNWQDNETLQAVIAAYAAPEEYNPDHEFARAELAGMVQHLLDQLPSNYATALELKYILGQGSQEIAGKLSISDQAAQSLLARARKAFRALCDETLPALLDGSYSRQISKRVES